MRNKKHIYIHDTDTIWSENGEIHFICSQGHVVWNLETLFNDLPTIIEYCMKEHDNKQKRIMESIKQILINKNK